MDKRVTWYGSSIGQKVISALTGLFLCAFLVVHVSGNLLLFKNDGGKSFDEYSTTASSSLLIRTIEVFLFAGFLIHIYWGIRVWLFNRRARTKGYVENHPSQNSSLFSRTMLLTGSLVLVFLFIHLRTFWLPMRFGAAELSSNFGLVRSVFRDPWYGAFYVVSLGLLAYHLRQGFQSAFQSLGVRSFWRKAIDWAAVIFWLMIPIGFALMPLYFLSGKGG